MFIPNPYFYPSRIRNTANKCHTVMKCRQSSQICESLISSSDRAPGQLITDPPDPSPRYCSSVADPGYLSRILIFTHPGSRIQKQQQKTGAKIFFCQTIFCIHKFHKSYYYFICGSGSATLVKSHVSSTQIKSEVKTQIRIWIRFVYKFQGIGRLPDAQLFCTTCN